MGWNKKTEAKSLVFLHTKIGHAPPTPPPTLDIVCYGKLLASSQETIGLREITNKPEHRHFIFYCYISRSALASPFCRLFFQNIWLFVFNVAPWLQCHKITQSPHIYNNSNNKTLYLVSLWEGTGHFFKKMFKILRLKKTLELLNLNCMSICRIHRWNLC